MTDIKDRLHQMMLRSGFQSRDDQQTLLAGVQEIERLRAAIAPLAPIASAILSEAPANADHYSLFLTCDGRALRVSMDELRAVAAYGRSTKAGMTISEPYAAELGRQVDELEAENALLRAALEPFAKISRAHPQWAADDPAYIEIDDGLTAADFHRANAVLGQSREQAMQELADQAQALDMGYGQSLKPES